MTAVITLTLAGSDTGPFNIYSDIDGYISAFANNVSKTELLLGYPTDQIPDGTTMIKIVSVNDVCTNYINIPTVPTTTTTTTII